MQGPAALLSPILFLFLASFFHQIAAASNPAPTFFPQSFFFDFNPPGTTVPIPVTEQCSTLHLTWQRGSTSTGPNPTSPYYLQIYLSTFIVPIIVPAGSGTSFDFTVPWVPGTQYQICMWDSRGVSGGCQGLYTVIPNSANASVSCQNVTYPASTLNVDAQVVDGAFSQYGWIPQCTDIQVHPKNGTPPYQFTIAPTLHPPLNITLPTSDPVNWTVSLSHGFPFFISLEDSQGHVWSQGPLHSGDGDDTGCLDLNHTEKLSSKSHTAQTIGAAAGGIVVGLLVGGAGIIALRRCRSRDSRANSQSRQNSEMGLGHAQGSREVSAITSGGNFGPGGLEYIVEPFSVPGSGGSDPSVPLLPGGAVPTTSPPDATSATGSTSPTELSGGSVGGRQGRPNVYVVHHDAGRAPVTVYTEGGAEVVELPPRYADNGSGSSQDGRSAIDRQREPGPQPRKARGPRPPAST